jgi:hypothetical protein
MSNQSGAVGLTPVLVDDFIEDLVWPKLLRSAGLAMSPQRLGIAFFTVIALGLLVEAANQLSMIGDAESGGRTTFLETFGREMIGVAAIFSGDPDATARALYQLFIGMPLALVQEHPLATLLLVPLMILVKVIGGGAIARSAAVDYGLGEASSWPRVLGFAAGRWLSLLGAVVGPLVIVWLVAVGLAMAGWVFFNAPVLNVIGGVLFGLFLLAALVATVVIIAYALGALMLTPAVMVEGTDGFDAVSRVYEFVFNRPVRLVLYLVVVLVQGIVALFVASLLAALVLLVARAAGGAWVGDRGEAATMGLAAEDAGVTWDTAAWFVRLWIAIPLALVTGYLFSYFYCAGTMLYLALRRVNDGQDMREVWAPGMVEGTMAEALAAKAQE